MPLCASRLFCRLRLPNQVLQPSFSFTDAAVSDHQKTVSLDMDGEHSRDDANSMVLLELPRLRVSPYVGAATYSLFMERTAANERIFCNARMVLDVWGWRYRINSYIILDEKRIFAC